MHFTCAALEVRALAFLHATLIWVTASAPATIWSVWIFNEALPTLELAALRFGSTTLAVKAFIPIADFLADLHLVLVACVICTRGFPYTALLS